MSQHTYLEKNSTRLGIFDVPTKRKANEFLRILNSKPASNTLNDDAKVVLCLDLATANMGLSFDRQTAIKLTGLQKSVYQNRLNNVEKILGIDTPLSISELCVQLSCTVAKDLAETIFNKYKEINRDKIADLNHPQYVAAAVFTATQLKKLKVNNKSKFVDASRLKYTQWKKLTEEFRKNAASLKQADKKSAKEEHGVPAEKQQSESASKKRKSDETVMEDYDTWRGRILLEAAEEIIKNELEVDD